MSVPMWRMGDTLVAIGFVLICAAVAWFSSFYGEAAEFVGGKGAAPPTECLYKMTGLCRTIAQGLSLTGARAYDPALFWAGAITAGIDGLLFFTAERPGRTLRRLPVSEDHGFTAQDLDGIARHDRVEPHFGEPPERGGVVASPRPQFPEGRYADIGVARMTSSTHRNRNAGVVAGALGIVFATLGIFTIGIVFVPLAALCTLVGFLRALGGLSTSGIGLSLVCGFLTFFGALVSPTVWALLGGGIFASWLATTPPREVAVSPTQPKSAVTRPLVLTNPNYRPNDVAPAPLVAPETEAIPRRDPEIVLNRDSSRVLRVADILRTPALCDDTVETGRVVSRVFDSGSVLPTGLTIVTAQGRRLFVNADVNLDDYSRYAASWVSEALQSMTQDGRVLTLKIKFCGGAGRAFLDGIARAD